MYLTPRAIGLVGVVTPVHHADGRIHDGWITLVDMTCANERLRGPHDSMFLSLDCHGHDIEAPS